MVDYADSAGMKHQSAIGVSIREKVVATISLTEENGRMSVFQDGASDDYRCDGLGACNVPLTEYSTRWSTLEGVG